MVAGAAGASVTGMTSVVDLFAGVAGKGVDVVGCFITGNGSIRTDGIWVMFMNVIMDISALSSTNEFYYMSAAWPIKSRQIKIQF